MYVWGGENPDLRFERKAQSNMSLSECLETTYEAFRPYRSGEMERVHDGSQMQPAPSFNGGPNSS